MLTQNGFDKCVLCAFIPTLAKKVFFFLWAPFNGYKAKNKTGNSTDKKRRFKN